MTASVNEVLELCQKNKVVTTVQEREKARVSAGMLDGDAYDRAFDKHIWTPRAH